jgi:hypothetical protein
MKKRNVIAFVLIATLSIAVRSTRTIRLATYIEEDNAD